METKTSINNPLNLTSFISEGVLCDGARYSFMNMLRPIIQKEVLNCDDVPMNIDSVVASGVWSLLRSVVMMMGNNDVDTVDELNIGLFIAVITENDQLFQKLVLKNHFLKAEFRNTDRILCEEDVLCNPNYTRCFITNIHLPRMARVDKITVGAKVLSVSREETWKRTGFRSLTTVQLFQLFFSTRSIRSRSEETVKKLSSQFKEEQNNPINLANKISTSPELMRYMVTLILEFQMMNDVIQNIVINSSL